jgi:hypothetical protein
MSSRATWVLLLSTLAAACGGGSDSSARAPITLTLAASPNSVAAGTAATLTWNSTGAESCTAEGAWSGAKPVSGSESTGPLTTSRTYQLTCTGAAGSESRSANVVVASAPPAPTLTLAANPSSVQAGSAAILTWSSENATTCTASGAWSGTKALTGSQTVSPSSTSSYNLVCTGPGGSVQRTSTVSVTAATPTPTVALSASPVTVSSGGSSTLTWTSTNATSCTASGAWSGSKATSGSQDTGALASTATYTLTCSGDGGTASDSATVTVGSVAGPAFPLHTEAGKRYLVDANGQPFFIHGDTPWSLIVQLTREQVLQYLDDRKAKGFNAILVNLIEHKFSDNPPGNAYGAAPFLTPGDFATPNPAYFDHAAYVVEQASLRGMVVFLTPSYMGFGGGDQGWYQEMSANGSTKLRAYGQFVANRFATYDNIVWVQGGDYNPPDLSLLRAIPNGIRDVSTKWPHTFHGSRGTSALGFLGTGEAWLSVNDIYTTEATVVSSAFSEHARSSMPFFLIEARYENDGIATETIIRTLGYQAALSGATGHFYGNEPIWRFGSGWQTALGDPGAATLRHLKTLFDSTAWWTLEPDTAGTLVTAGVGSGATRTAAALATNRSFALVYVPSVRSVTVDMNRLSGPHVRARWYDPTNGAYTSVAGSPFVAASGSVFLTPTGNNSRGLGDWVLVLESVP